MSNETPIEASIEAPCNLLYRKKRSRNKSAVHTKTHVEQGLHLTKLESRECCEKNTNRYVDKINFIVKQQY